MWLVVPSPINFPFVAYQKSSTAGQSLRAFVEQQGYTANYAWTYHEPTTPEIDEYFTRVLGALIPVCIVAFLLSVWCGKTDLLQCWRSWCDSESSGDTLEGDEGAKFEKEPLREGGARPKAIAPIERHPRHPSHASHASHGSHANAPPNMRGRSQSGTELCNRIMGMVGGPASSHPHDGVENDDDESVIGPLSRTQSTANSSVTQRSIGNNDLQTTHSSSSSPSSSFSTSPALTQFVVGLDGSIPTRRLARPPTSTSSSYVPPSVPPLSPRSVLGRDAVAADTSTGASTGTTHRDTPPATSHAHFGTSSAIQTARPDGHVTTILGEAAGAET